MTMTMTSLAPDIKLPAAQDCHIDFFILKCDKARLLRNVQTWNGFFQ
jgi:hypothetical protein